MLKAQLHSKYFQVEENWRADEDLLTGDFFGVLDYLPRALFLADFLSRLQPYQTDSLGLDLEEVDWEHVKFDFWPMKHGEDENAEPDLVLVSNRWLLVVEVKLDSGLGHRQPWREYVVGQQFARERNLSGDSVRYVIVARDRLDLGPTFLPNEGHLRHHLLARSFHLRWSDVVATVESWLRHGAGGGQLIDEQIRILDDLLQVMRRRRNIAFEGFAFTNQDDVQSTSRRLFCPPSFEGFLMRRLCAVAVGSAGFFECFDGFGTHVPNVRAMRRSPWPVSKFSGFMYATKRCRSQSTMIF